MIKFPCRSVKSEGLKMLANAMAEEECKDIQKDNRDSCQYAGTHTRARQSCAPRNYSAFLPFSRFSFFSVWSRKSPFELVQGHHQPLLRAISAASCSAIWNASKLFYAYKTFFVLTAIFTPYLEMLLGHLSLCKIFFTSLLFCQFSKLSFTTVQFRCQFYTTSFSSSAYEYIISW